MSHKTVLKELFPIPLSGRFEEDITIEGDHLDAAEASATELLTQILPTTADADTIADWEQTFAISSPIGTDLATRRAYVLAELTKRGGLSRTYFTGLAAALGYTVVIEDMRPFECGVAMCGYPIWEEGIKWCWLVRVMNHTTVAGDFVGKTAAAYTADGDGWAWTWDVIAGPLEKTFNRLKKSGGVVLFVYPTVTYP